MKIKKVSNKEEALICNELLTKLVQDEKKYNENIRDDFVVKNWFENLYTKNNNVIFIAIEEEKIIGYIYIKITSSIDGPEVLNEALIDGLFVLEKYRNRGIATMLIKEAKKWCKEKDVRYVYLNVLYNNKNALKLYEKEDFKFFSINLKTNL